MESGKTWKSHPSVWIYFGRVMLCLLLSGLYVIYGRSLVSELYVEIGDTLIVGINIAVLAIIAIKVATTSYELQSERLIVKEGLMVQIRNEAELYRIKDYRVIRPLLLRILGLSHLVLYSSDHSCPKLLLKGLLSGDKKMDQIRQRVEELRKTKRVYEVD